MHTAAFNKDHDVLIFLRIPKTASSSIASALTNTFGQDRTAQLPDRHIDGLDFGLTRAHDQLRRFGMRVSDDLIGHSKRIVGQRDLMAHALFLHGHHPLWAPIRTRRRRHYFTVFREPTDRFLSLYYYYLAKAKRSSRSSSIEKRAIVQMEPSDYVHWIVKNCAPKRLNSQCLYLSRNGTFDGAHHALQHSVILSSTLHEIPQLREELSHFLHTRLPAIPHKNAGTVRDSRSPLDEKAQRVLRAALEQDYRLYEHVNARKSNG